MSECGQDVDAVLDAPDEAMPHDGAEPVLTGRIFNIQRFSTEDGPGIRTTVFLKGCPLTCLWCSNPESQQTHRQLAHNDALCDRCGRCITACSRRAISLTDAGVSVNRDRCDNCGDCVQVCGPRSLRMIGDDKSVDEVLDEILKDRHYYRSSQGGVTCSGGEPLMQAPFVAALFERCQEAGLHTTLDTTGHGSAKSLAAVLRHTNLVLFDLKVMNDALHRRTTGITNRQILRNARLVSDSSAQMIIRVPLIPGVSDADENIAAIARFVKELRPGIVVNVLPYHRFGMNKYRMLDQPYPMDDAQPPTHERVAQIVAMFESAGLACEIVT
ncbi:MAG: glycyl-radical enzyme activating protein [Steroidobacteraceae bacterium]|jgi:pyruvate formate lyase activating enzyme|nr:glycyl-radical enzyme activating protein [Steroidobacteraceae bacterium]